MTSTKLPRLAQLVIQNPLIELMKLPEVGRALIAVSDIPYGSVIHRETPLVSSPSVVARRHGTSSLDQGSTCYGCLQQINSSYSTRIEVCGSREYIFCSDSCHAEAAAKWFEMEKRVFSKDQQFESYCLERGIKFPLLAARVAFSKLQDMKYRARHHSAKWSESGTEWRLGKDINFLCYVNMEAHHQEMDTSALPRDWVESHGILMNSLKYTLLDGRSSPLGEECTEMEHIGQVEEWLHAISLPWYSSMLSRIHVNSFRVDTIPIQATSRESLLRAAMHGGSSAGSSCAAPGSAVYLLGSMFNHSCTPNVDIHFPRNNHVIEFRAAMDIAKYTELTISYVDVELPKHERQDMLWTGYGFVCKCSRCQSPES